MVKTGPSLVVSMRVGFMAPILDSGRAISSACDADLSHGPRRPWPDGPRPGASEGPTAAASLANRFSHRPPKRSTICRGAFERRRDSIVARATFRKAASKPPRATTIASDDAPSHGEKDLALVKRWRRATTPAVVLSTMLASVSATLAALNNGRQPIPRPDGFKRAFHDATMRESIIGPMRHDETIDDLQHIVAVQISHCASGADPLLSPGILRKTRYRLAPAAAVANAPLAPSAGIPPRSGRTIACSIRGHDNFGQ
jgi:hypothetical protein